MGAFALTAQQFRASAPSQVIEGQRFNVTYTLTNGDTNDKPHINEVGGSRLVYGPGISQQSSISVINGKTSSSSSISYTYSYTAQKAGTYSVKGATINVNGKTLTSNSITISILPPDKRAAANRGSQGSGGVDITDANTMSSDKAVSSNDVLVRITMNKSAAYEQEAIVCTIKVYTKYEISGFVPTQQPSFDGFLIEELPVEARLSQIEHINGQNYYSAVLKKCILYPQKSGKLTITSGNYDITVRQFEREESAFGFSHLVPVDKKIVVKSNSETMNITPLPEPRPASFDGAVGNYRLSGGLTNGKFRTGEASNYTINIVGSGNIKFLKNPKLTLPDNFDLYDPQTSNDVHVDGATMSGSAKWEYTFIPQEVGEYDIPKYEFTFFNLATKQYETLSLAGQHVNVTKGVGSTSKGEIEKAITDILPIIGSTKGDGEIVNVFTFLYWLWYIIPMVILGAVLFIYRKQIKLRSNIALMKNRKAGKVARKRLKVARQFMDKHDARFYEETLKAIWGYLSDKLAIPVSNLNRENIANELSTYGADEELIKDVMNVLDECEFAQYAPSQNDGQMSEVYSRTSDFMDKVENIKR